MRPGLRTRTYTWIVVCFSLGLALVSASILWFEYQNIKHAQQNSFASQLNLSQMKHLKTITGNWLTTIDLFFAGKDTYLVEGIADQGDQINEVLQGFTILSDKSSVVQILEKTTSLVKESVKQIQNLVNNLPISNNKWNQQLEDSDVITLQIVNNTTSIEAIVRAQYEHYTQIAHQRVEEQKVLALSLSLLYVLIIIYLVHWATKNIVSPIELITQRSKMAVSDNKVLHIPQERGPTEVQELAQALTLMLKHAEKQKSQIITEIEQKQFAEARFKRIMENAPSAIILTDEHGKILDCNPITQDVFNRSEVELKSSNIASIVASFGQLDGSIDLDEILNESKETRIVTPSGEKTVICSGVRASITDESQLLINIQDITDIKQKEIKLNELNQHLIEVDKLISIGQMASGTAHEINNPTCFIASNLNTLKDYIEEIRRYVALSLELSNTKALRSHYKELDLEFILEDISPLISSAIEGTDRIKNIVNELGSFSHQYAESFEITDIKSAINQAILFTSKGNKQTIVPVETALIDNVLVMGHQQKLSQVFINLINNALSAIGNRENASVMIAMFESSDSCTIRVRDSGPGIPQNLIPRLFDPFFTTKSVGEGTGLGLHIVSTIILQHNGSISVNSNIGEGTEFIITLPKHLEIENHL